MAHTDRYALIVKTFLDRGKCFVELAYQYCSGKFTPEHVTMMERRARIGQTFPHYKPGPNQSEYNAALEREFSAASNDAENVVPDTTITIQNRVRIRLLLECHYTEMQACAVHHNAASLYRTVSDTRSQVRIFAWQFTHDEVQYFLKTDFTPHFLNHEDFTMKRCEVCTLERSKIEWHDMGLWCSICNNAICGRCRATYGIGCACEKKSINEHSVLLPRHMNCEKCST
eukprot:2162590-Karenia_brevis.AAC.1